MARIASVADIHRNETNEKAGYPHARRPLAGVRVYIQVTPAQIAHIEQKLGTTRGALREYFGPEWTYSGPNSQMLVAVYDISDNPWGLKNTTEIAKRALELANRKLDTLRRRG